MPRTLPFCPSSNFEKWECLSSENPRGGWNYFRFSFPRRPYNEGGGVEVNIRRNLIKLPRTTDQ